MVEKDKESVESKSKSMKRGEKHAGKKKVKFKYCAPEAKEVSIAGEFNGWDTCSLPMKRGKDGIWKVEIKLSPNCYEYKLFVDGSWVEGISCTVEVDGECDLNILCSEMVFNSLGTQNCVFRVS